MARATVDRKVLDTLIRAKVATLRPCLGVRPLPVAWQEPDEHGSNWAVSGWAGEAEAVRACVEQIQAYLQILHANFQIARDS